MQLGMVGLGRMGAKMVRRMLKREHQCVVFDLSTEAVKTLVREGRGGVVAGGIREPAGEAAVDLVDGTGCAATLEEIAGSPPVLDLVHLGLGLDGHTASLVPADPVVEVTNSDVALTGVYQGRRRMTLTYPILNRARRVLWLVTGSDKAELLVRLCNRDVSIPAGRVRQDRALLLADQAAVE